MIRITAGWLRRMICAVAACGAPAGKLAIALLALGISDLILRGRTFSGIREAVRRMPVKPVLPGAALDEILGAFNSACMVYFHSVRCLQRSAALTFLLRLHGIPAKLIVGCRSMPFYSHAWVEVNGEVVNDRSNMRTILSVIDSV